MALISLVAPSGGIRRTTVTTLITRDQRYQTPSQSPNIERNKIQKRKQETNDLTRFGNLPTSSGQKGEYLIQTNRVIEVTNWSGDPNWKSTQISHNRRISTFKTIQNRSIQNRSSNRHSYRYQWGCRNPPYIARGESQLKETKLDTKFTSKYKLESNSNSPDRCLVDRLYVPTAKPKVQHQKNKLCLF